MVAHIIPGLFFFLTGLWHLFNHIKLHALHSKSYTALPWFPTSNSKYLELFFTMGFCCLCIIEELYLRPFGHHLLDPHDGSLPFAHLHDLEHFSIFFSFFIYAVFTLLLNQLHIRTRNELSFFLNALAYTQAFFLMHVHTTDHMGPEGQYHLLLQLLTLVCSATSLMGIGLPKSFFVSFVRSLAEAFGGIWLLFMGVMLWTPSLMPKDCFLHLDKIMHQRVVRCSGEEAFHRANSLVNLQFSWFTTGIAVFGVSFYLVLVKIYDQKVEYISVLEVKQEETEGDEDMNTKEQSKEALIKV